MSKDLNMFETEILSDLYIGRKLECHTSTERAMVKRGLVELQSDGLLQITEKGEQALSPEMRKALDGIWIRNKREELGMTQEDLAPILGVSPNTIARWERAEMSPRSMRAIVLAIESLSK
jgi:DNA-binding transcriptional regulator YiaG